VNNGRRFSDEEWLTPMQIARKLGYATDKPVRNVWGKEIRFRWAAVLVIGSDCASCWCVCCIGSCAASFACSPGAAVSGELEIVVLRDQLAILGRGGKRPRYSTVDRALLAAASRLLPPERWSCFAVSPRTLRRCHRALLEGGRRGRRRRLGRPPLAAATRGLIERLARENPRWG
jgi:hypothetical protein